MTHEYFVMIGNQLYLPAGGAHDMAVAAGVNRAGPRVVKAHRTFEHLQCSPGNVPLLLVTAVSPLLLGSLLFLCALTSLLLLQCLGRGKVQLIQYSQITITNCNNG